MRAQRRHSLHRNDRVWSPHHIAFWDTEFPIDPAWGGQGQPFKCAVARAGFRHGKGRITQPSSEIRTTSKEELADWFEKEAKGGVPLWTYAHHVAVDLKSSDLLNILLRRGWELGRNGLANPHPWAHLRKGRKTIRICDSMSLFGLGEKVLGQLVDLPKLTMPGRNESLEAWLDYCERDVEIGMVAISEAMDEWDRRRLGRWTDTGPGCGWNALRHTIQERTVWIDPDDAARTFERAAIYAGRREVTQVGKLPERDYVDLDMTHAHASVAAIFPIPFGRGIRFDGLPLDSHWVLREVVGVIARVRIRCDRPRYPLRTDRGVLYPVGDFWTTLPGPEIEEARRRGELVEIGAGIAYQLSDWPSDYARWVCAALDRQLDDMGEVFRCLVKGWSKTVWGRSAMRGAGTVEESEGPHDDLVIERGWDEESGNRLTILNHGWRRWEIHQDQEGDDSFPAILAWIQSWVRVLVGRLADQLGDEAVVQIATDGVLVAPWKLAELVSDAGLVINGKGDLSDVAEASCKILTAATAPLEVRLKDILHRVELLGPDHLVSEEETRLAGVPRSAKKVARLTYQGEVWPSFLTMTHEGSAGEVVVGQRVWHLDKVRPLRWVHADGCCEPVRCTVGPAGETRLLGNQGALCSRHGAPLTDRQHPALARLLSEAGAADQVTSRRPPSVQDSWPGSAVQAVGSERKRLGHKS